MAALSRRSLLVLHPMRAKANFPIKRAPRLAFGELPTPEPMEADPITGWHSKCRRTGVLAVKLGMTRDWDDVGQAYPLTILHVPNCQVVQVKTIEGDGKYALQLGSGDAKLKRTPRAMMGHFARAAVPPKKKTSEFDVTQDCLLPVGTTIYAQHYIPGMKVDITGTTKGKGFQGVMKRWGFGGQPKTHGVSLTHRSIGSTGNRQTPGRVFKGKKMAGHMGCKLRTARGLMVFKIDPYLNTIYVKGAVPGPSNGWVRIFDTPHQEYLSETPPFPTYIPRVGEVVPLESKILHDDLPARLRINDTLGHPNNYMSKRWSLLGPTRAQLDVFQKPQTMQELVKAALEKRKKDKDAITTRQQLEKQKQKKIIKAAKRKAIDVDD